eukprot:jgi/Bigna1/58818/fgenesh1_kg.1_\
MECHAPHSSTATFASSIRRSFGSSLNKSRTQYEALQVYSQTASSEAVRKLRVAVVYFLLHVFAFKPAAAKCSLEEFQRQLRKHTVTLSSLGRLATVKGNGKWWTVLQKRLPS